MNREDIIRMAREAGGGLSSIAEPLEHPWKFSEAELIRFAALVAYAERESLRESFRIVTAAEASAAILHERKACADLCDRFANRMMSAEECADAIRARGQA